MTLSSTRGAVVSIITVLAMGGTSGWKQEVLLVDWGFSVFHSGSVMTGTEPGIVDHEDRGGRVQFWLVLLLLWVV